MSWAFDQCQQRYDNEIPEDRLRFLEHEDDEEPEREEDLDMDEDWHG
jgi:hypothetical protein